MTPSIKKWRFFPLSVFLVFHRSGLQIRKFPTCNTYMDDPFDLSLTSQEQPIYSNTSVLEHKVCSRCRC